MSGKLGDILIAQGVIDEEKLIAALSDQRAFGGKLGRTLVDLGYVNEEQLMRALAEQLGLETVELDTLKVTDEALSCLPVDACERYGVFPVRVDNEEKVLWVATAEPDRQTLQEVASISQYTIEPVLSSMSSIDRAVRQYYFGERAGAKKGRLGEPLKAIPGDVEPMKRITGRKPDAAPPPPLEDEMPEAQVEPDPHIIGAISPESGPDAIHELKHLIIRLEKTVNAQSRAFRALVDLLQEKGVVRRGELGQRTSKK
jgi:type IV pilus assembly protein PilB